MKTLTSANKSAISRALRNKYCQFSLTWKGQSAKISFPEDVSENEYKKVLDWLECMVLRRFKVNIVFDVDAVSYVP